VTRAIGAAILAFSLVLAIASGAAATQREEAIGQHVYEDLNAKHEILVASPLYAQLQPIANRIKAVADPLYDYPFHFVLVHEADPNAFSVPGGNVYVTDTLMHFVKSKEELAGVLCHEVSHDIHHDVIHEDTADTAVVIAAGLAAGLTSNRYARALIGGVAAESQLHFSRSAEKHADLTGSDICAQAGFNPYGMIWLFSQFEAQGYGGRMEFFSDHPSDGHRIRTLENHFKLNPRRFGSFSSDPATGTPLE
jgi:predicted Zn-dependent protease